MYQKFHMWWGTVRAGILVAMIVGALLFLVFEKTMGATIDGIEYVGPGSEAERTEREARDKENERAYERERNNESDRSERERERDRERASDWSRDHLA